MILKFCLDLSGGKHVDDILLLPPDEDNIETDDGILNVTGL